VPRDDSYDVKMQKTLNVLGVVNLLLSPLLLVDARFALTAALIVNALLISQLHEIGRKRRVGSNLINQGRTFFSGSFLSSNISTQGTSSEINTGEIENAIKNVINGGGAIYDEVTSYLQTHRM
jgi:hypothetical protein